MGGPFPRPLQGRNWFHPLPRRNLQPCPTPHYGGQTQKVSTFLFFKKEEKVEFFFFVSLNYLTMPVIMTSPPKACVVTA